MTVIERLGLMALHRIDPERAHDLSLKALRMGLVPLHGGPVTSERLATSAGGLALPNVVGLAAGYDKNAMAVAALMRAGFGFIETGAATPLPQAGNPKPRLFRIPEARGVINRFGFNNDGATEIGARLALRPQGDVPVGLNVGAGKDSPDRAKDFAQVVAMAGAAVDFLTVNVSSPNTERLRDLQGAAALEALLAGVLAARDALPDWVPVWVKIAPDLDAEALSDIAAIAVNLRLDAIVATNTTIGRESVDPRWRNQAGGLSGKPLFQRSTAVLARLHQLTAGAIDLIGVGGIASAEDAWAKLAAGASAVQLYSGLVYEGMSLVPKIALGLDERLAAESITLSELKGRDAGKWL